MLPSQAPQFSARVNRRNTPQASAERRLAGGIINRQPGLSLGWLLLVLAHSASMRKARRRPAWVYVGEIQRIQLAHRMCTSRGVLQLPVAARRAIQHVSRPSLMRILHLRDLCRRAWKYARPVPARDNVFAARPCATRSSRGRTSRNEDATASSKLRRDTSSDKHSRRIEPRANLTPDETRSRSISRFGQTQPALDAASPGHRIVIHQPLRHKRGTRIAAARENQSVFHRDLTLGNRNDSEPCLKLPACEPPFVHQHVKRMAVMIASSPIARSCCANSPALNSRIAARYSQIEFQRHERLPTASRT